MEILRKLGLTQMGSQELKEKAIERAKCELVILTEMKIKYEKLVEANKAYIKELENNDASE